MKGWLIFRTSLYALLFGSLAAVPPERLFPHSFCLLYHLTGRRCPGCGMTRAFCCILHGRFAEAWAWNPFSALMFPLCAALAADELAALVLRLAGRERRSLCERLLGLRI